MTIAFAYPQLLSLCLPLHCTVPAFFEGYFSYQAKNIHIPEKPCYTDFLSSEILFEDKKRWYKMIPKDHLHHMWHRAGINFNFLPGFFSLWAISHTSCVEEDIELRSAELLSRSHLSSSLRPTPASIWAGSKDNGEQQTVCLHVFTFFI